MGETVPKEGEGEGGRREDEDDQEEEVKYKQVMSPGGIDCRWYRSHQALKEPGRGRSAAIWQDYSEQRAKQMQSPGTRVPCISVEQQGGHRGQNRMMR